MFLAEFCIPPSVHKANWAEGNIRRFENNKRNKTKMRQGCGGGEAWTGNYAPDGQNFIYIHI
jgi:hypothetical protein